MEKQNTLNYIKAQLESLLDFNSADDTISDVWAYVNDIDLCPAGAMYVNILIHCMEDNSRKAYFKNLIEKYHNA